MSTRTSRSTLDLRKLKKCSLIELRLFAGRMRIFVPDDYEPEDVLQLIEAETDERMKRYRPKLVKPKDRVPSTSTLVIPVQPRTLLPNTPEAESSSHIKTNVLVEKASRLAICSSEESIMQGKDSGHGTTPSPIAEEPGLPAYDQRPPSTFDALLERENEELDPTVEDYDSRTDDDIDSAEQDLPRWKLAWVNAMSDAFDEEIENNDRELASLRKTIDKSILEAALAEIGIAKADILQEKLEDDLIEMAGLAVFDEYRKKMANYRSDDNEDEEEVEVEASPKAGPSGQNRVNAENEEYMHDKDQLVAPSPPRAGPSSHGRSSIGFEAPMLAEQKRRKRSRSQAWSSEDSGDDEKPIRKKMRYGEAPEHPSAVGRRSRIGKGASHKSSAALDKYSPEVAVASSSNIPSHTFATPVNADESTFFPPRIPTALRARVERGFDNDIDYEASSSEGQQPSRINPLFRENGDMFTPVDNALTGDLVKFMESTADAPGSSVPRPRRSPHSSGLIQSGSRRSSGKLSQRAMERAALRDDPMVYLDVLL
ncbi:hypothetical protein BC629DRAFT_1193355 [Irpex lacteus]|nr:hypothetical protein BC629DRAFT_1193355 [Irpex lacteus]